MRAPGAWRRTFSSISSVALRNASLSAMPTRTAPSSVLCARSREQTLATTGYGTEWSSVAGSASCPRATGTPRRPNNAPASCSLNMPERGSSAGQAKAVPGAGGLLPWAKYTAKASAHASGVRKAAMPPARSSASDSGASGARNTASGLSSGLSASSSGLTASAGWNWADDPTTLSTASHQPARSSSSSNILYWALLAARVKSMTGVSRMRNPCCAMRCTKSGGGATATMPCSPRLSTTVAAPPPVVVITATRAGWSAAPGAGRLRVWRDASGAISNSVSR